MNENQKFAMCGCRYDLCKAYTPNVAKDDQRKELAEMLNKYFGLDPLVVERCDGCRNNPSEEDCPIRKCVLDKEFNHCGDCDAFPCDIFQQRCMSFSEEKKKDLDTDEYNEYILAYDNEARIKEYRSKQKQLKRVSEETMRFMRGRYALDEVGNKKDELAFRDGNRTILTIYVRDGFYDFQVGENKVRVSDTESFEEAKRMILSCKEPNRKPFPKEQAVYSDCGHRCDLCIHYSGGTISDEFREELKKRLKRVYEPDNTGSSEYWDGNMRLCPGCHNGGFDGEANPCRQKKCAIEKKVARCMECAEYRNCAPQVGYRCGIEPRSISADDVTWAILPYVDDQYGN